MKICVIPTCRPAALRKWLEAWGPVADWHKLIVVCDGPASQYQDVSAESAEVWNWDSIADHMGDDAWIISHHDSAIRCFGFYRAWQLGAEYIGTLDDDCFPVGREWVATHIANLLVARWRSSVADLRVRGLPYDPDGSFNAALNIGLWSGDPDLDAVTRLANNRTSYQPDTCQQVVPSGVLVPMCGMNLAFRGDLAPALFFPLMGAGYPYRRMDDIWGGIFAKRICDHLGLAWTIGEPVIEHRRLSEPMAALAAEAPGIVANETFWRWVMCGRITGETPAECMLSLAESLRDYCGEYRDADYKRTLCDAMQVWAGLFSSSGRKPDKSAACDDHQALSVAKRAEKART